MTVVSALQSQAGTSRARSAVAAPSGLSPENADFVLRRLFSAGLAVGSCVRLLDDTAARRLTTLIDGLDEVSTQVRRAVTTVGSTPFQPDPYAEGLVRAVREALVDLAEGVDGLHHGGGAGDIPTVDLLDVVQSLQRALALLRAPSTI